ncbi:MAG TPA: DUF4192 domain-containing protein [Actinophytocola sp.]|jgi:hypothetical protein|uniref:DUF4192 domain-containing protein n=1 Tax=Actinophytocola sp. TaxID=1872138 RepID=UPI002F937A64
MTPPPAPPSSTEGIYLDNLGELIAGLPSMLGFPPTDSFVLVTFHVTDRLQLGATVRMDLPEPRHGPDMVSQLCLATIANEPDVAVPVVIGGGSADPPELPYRWLVDLVTHELGEVDIPTVHALWVPAIEEGETWWCYEDEECTGQVRDPRSSSFAVFHVLAGVVRYGSRAEMAGHLAPDPEDRVAHRAQLLAARTGQAVDVDASAKWATVRAALDETTEIALPELEDERIVLLAEALCDPLVRDNCLPLVITGEADAAERLWTVLVRAIPAPERAEPASLLAVHAYLRGDGVVANMALEVALDANPGHHLALLLRESIDRGMPPGRFRAMVEESVAWAEQVNVEEAGR